ncbi:MAG TPA: hypothetical protein VIM42_08665, partial [Clostridium sp.]
MVIESEGIIRILKILHGLTSCMKVAPAAHSDLLVLYVMFVIGPKEQNRGENLEIKIVKGEIKYLDDC